MNIVTKIIVLLTSSLLVSNISFDYKKYSDVQLVFKDSQIDSDSGYRIETVITELSQSTRATSNITGIKKTSVYSGNELLWSVSVTGTFSYGNGSSRALSSIVTTNVSNGSWKITSSNSTYYGNTAKATATAKRYLLGIPVETIVKTVELSCDSNGKLY